MRTSMDTDDCYELGVDDREWEDTWEDTEDWLPNELKGTSTRMPVAWDAKRSSQILDQIGATAKTVVMTPSNPHWAVFTRRLDSAIREKGCDGFSFRLSKWLIGSMRGIDVSKSVSFFEGHDCLHDGEVLLDAKQRGMAAMPLFGIHSTRASRI